MHFSKCHSRACSLKHPQNAILNQWTQVVFEWCIDKRGRWRHRRPFLGLPICKRTNWRVKEASEVKNRNSSNHLVCFRRRIRLWLMACSNCLAGESWFLCGRRCLICWINKTNYARQIGRLNKNLHEVLERLWPQNDDFSLCDCNRQGYKYCKVQPIEANDRSKQSRTRSPDWCYFGGKSPIR